ncbi:hypothetical protein ACCS48_34350, partial [Rhizobium brockwellii]
TIAIGCDGGQFTNERKGKPYMRFSPKETAAAGIILAATAIVLVPNTQVSALAVDLAPSGVGLAVLAISSLGLPHWKRLGLALRRPTVSEF